MTLLESLKKMEKELGDKIFIDPNFTTEKSNKIIESINDIKYMLEKTGRGIGPEYTLCLLIEYEFMLRIGLNQERLYRSQ